MVLADPIETGPGIMSWIGNPDTFDNIISLNVKGMGGCEGCGLIEIERIQKLNRTLLERHLDVFAFDYQAPAPTFTYIDVEEQLGSGMVMSRIMKHSYDAERLVDLKVIHGDDAERLLLEETVDFAADEFRKFREDLPDDLQMAWYIPLWPIKAVNPDTWQPRIVFKTRYALIPSLARVTNT